jgi:dihydroxy-acid dehydratase
VSRSSTVIRDTTVLRPRRDCFFVQGAKRGAIYHLSKGDVYSFEALGAKLMTLDGRALKPIRDPCAGYVFPEAARGGPFALVENGDLIRIDIPQRRLEVVGVQGTPMSQEKVEEILHERKRRWVMPKFPPRSGVLKRYLQSAAPANKGAYTEY